MAKKIRPGAVAAAPRPGGPDLADQSPLTVPAHAAQASPLSVATDGCLSAPASKAGRLQRICLEMLKAREGEPDGLPTSVRFIYYELIQQGVVAKEKTGARRPDQDVQEAITWLRKRGLVPWSWIVDETRSLTTWRYAATVADFVKNSVDRARIDVWDGDDPPVVLTESRSLAGVLHDLAGEYLVSIGSTNGQVGGFLYTDVAPVLSVGQRVLYLGDFDWQGGQIEANTRRVLEREVGGELLWERLAITEEQVAQNDLPVISKPDKRYRPVRYHDAVETEALGQSVIVGIVRDRLDALLPEPLADVLEREEAQQAKVRAALARIARTS